VQRYEYNFKQQNKTRKNNSTGAKVQQSARKTLGEARKVAVEGESLYAGKGLLPEGNVTANHRDGLGRDV
jgi:hypothetical protein